MSRGLAFHTITVHVGMELAYVHGASIPGFVRWGFQSLCILQIKHALHVSSQHTVFSGYEGKLPARLEEDLSPSRSPFVFRARGALHVLRIAETTTQEWRPQRSEKRSYRTFATVKRKTHVLVSNKHKRGHETNQNIRSRSSRIESAQSS